MMIEDLRPLAVVTGASSGIGYELMAAVTPQSVLAQQHRKMAEPGSGQR
ncbi:hypothetical protein [Caulobacter sp. RL271]|uniref:Short-chain dehydrogenase/reductase SDR n=1 Tax=Caulobacter segnis TaxID=88688 RepID=A0ABY4ZRS8_9CAUL|nr:hypothetical protein [Caulobacter segnis]USQ95329.1 hypothetical protein MZV50_22705 [Caulobacter segnis]